MSLIIRNLPFNYNCVQKRLQVHAVLLPLVFISDGNCSDVYILVRISNEPVLL